MADNTLQNGTANIATDGILTLNGGAVTEVQAQRVKVGFGSDSVFRDVDESNGLPVMIKSAVALTTLSAANTTATLTIPAVAGQFHYITRIRITMHNTTATAVAGSAVTLSFTTTNIPTSLSWTEGNALAAGSTKVVVDEMLDNPIKSSTVNTATTIVAPACGSGVLTRITAYYYTGT